MVAPHKISSREYKQMVAELTEILYREFCQPEELTKTTITAPVQKERTGTDG